MTDRELMQQALEALEVATTPLAKDRQEVLRAQAALRERLAQPEQEPVAWMYHGIRHDDTPHERPSLIWKPEYMDVMSAEKGAKATPLYTTPPQRKPLTDEEINSIWDGHVVPVFGKNGINPIVFARAIEAKLKEKNT